MTTIVTIKLQTNTKSESIAKFIKSVSIRNKNTAKQYYSHLLSFERFVQQEQYDNKKISIDNLVEKLKNGELDPYDV
jgi:hypothetical protein